MAWKNKLGRTKGGWPLALLLIRASRQWVANVTLLGLTDNYVYYKGLNTGRLASMPCDCTELLELGNYANGTHRRADNYVYVYPCRLLKQHRNKKRAIMSVVCQVLDLSSSKTFLSDSFDRHARWNHML